MIRCLCVARNADEKFKTAVSRNTFWFHNSRFEREYEAHVTTMRETLLVMRNQVRSTGLTRELLVDLIAEKEYGLRAILALVGLSIEELLADMGINYTRGDLPKLKQHDRAGKRMMDFIIPDRNDPQVIIESSYMTTTSSGQGDKSKVELSMRQLIKKHYPPSAFLGFC